jgi:hypothetical protein
MSPRNYGLRPDNRPVYEPPPYGSSAVLRVATLMVGCLLLAALIASAFAVAFMAHELVVFL